MRTVLIAGCGNIGYRHLQAVCGLSDLAAVYLMEPDRQRLQRILTGDMRPQTHAPIHDFATSHSTLPEHFDVFISAVTANVRPKHIEALELLPFETGILEKPLAQSTSELQKINNLLQERAPKAAIYVNCPRRLYPGYVRLRNELTRQAGSSPLHFEVFGNAWGYGSNAVHFIDLFRYLTSSASLTTISAQLAQAPEGNKRGARFEEFVGTASFRNSRGDTLQLTCGSVSTTPSRVVILIREDASQRPLFLVDETGGFIHDFLQAEKSKLEPLFVSQATRLFLEGTPESDSLPTLDEATLSHTALFESLELATGRSSFHIT